jgi:MSHA pilin protein MshA
VTQTPQRKHSKQSGFTLLELVIVVIIIGILAAVAVPKFFDLAGKAEENALKATAANLGSAATLNYGACKLGATGCVALPEPCADVGALLLTPPLDTTKYTIGGAPPTCTLTLIGSDLDPVEFPVPVDN